MLSLPAARDRFELEAGATKLAFTYFAPERFHRLSLGLGIGPYAYLYSHAGEYLSTPSPLLTFYGSYYLTDTARFAVFDATAFNSRMNSDLGFYVNTENARAIDNRLSIHLLLGVHFIGIDSDGAYHLLFGAPQGFELVFSDALRQGSRPLGGLVSLPEQ